VAPNELDCRVRSLVSDAVRLLDRVPDQKKTLTDFSNIFAKKFGDNNCDFLLKLLLVLQIYDHNIVFLDKRKFSGEIWQKSQKIVIITSIPGQVA
jgi:hypothetical protein